MNFDPSIKARLNVDSVLLSLDPDLTNDISEVGGSGIKTTVTKETWTSGQHLNTTRLSDARRPILSIGRINTALRGDTGATNNGNMVVTRVATWTVNVDANQSQPQILSRASSSQSEAFGPAGGGNSMSNTVLPISNDNIVHGTVSNSKIGPVAEVSSARDTGVHTNTQGKVDSQSSVLYTDKMQAAEFGLGSADLSNSTLNDTYYYYYDDSSATWNETTWPNNNNSETGKPSNEAVWQYNSSGTVWEREITVNNDTNYGSGSSILTGEATQANSENYQTKIYMTLGVTANGKTVTENLDNNSTNNQLQSINSPKPRVPSSNDLLSHYNASRADSQKEILTISTQTEQKIIKVPDNIIILPSIKLGLPNQNQRLVDVNVTRLKQTMNVTDNVLKSNKILPTSDPSSLILMKDQLTRNNRFGVQESYNGSLYSTEEFNSWNNTATANETYVYDRSDTNNNVAVVHDPVFATNQPYFASGEIFSQPSGTKIDENMASETVVTNYGTDVNSFDNTLVNNVNNIDTGSANVKTVQTITRTDSTYNQFDSGIYNLDSFVQKEAKIGQGISVMGTQNDRTVGRLDDGTNYQTSRNKDTLPTTDVSGQSIGRIQTDMRSVNAVDGQTNNIVSTVDENTMQTVAGHRDLSFTDRRTSDSAAVSILTGESSKLSAIGIPTSKPLTVLFATTTPTSNTEGMAQSVPYTKAGQHNPSLLNNEGMGQGDTHNQANFFVDESVKVDMFGGVPVKRGISQETVTSSASSTRTRYDLSNMFDVMTSSAADTTHASTQSLFDKQIDASTGTSQSSQMNFQWRSVEIPNVATTNVISDNGIGSPLPEVSQWKTATDTDKRVSTVTTSWPFTTEIEVSNIPSRLSVNGTIKPAISRNFQGSVEEAVATKSSSVVDSVRTRADSSNFGFYDGSIFDSQIQANSGGTSFLAGQLDIPASGTSLTSANSGESSITSIKGNTVEVFTGTTGTSTREAVERHTGPSTKIQRSTISRSETDTPLVGSVVDLNADGVGQPLNTLTGGELLSENSFTGDVVAFQNVNNVANVRQEPMIRVEKTVNRMTRTGTAEESATVNRATLEKKKLGIALNGDSNVNNIASTKLRTVHIRTNTDTEKAPDVMPPIVAARMPRQGRVRVKAFKNSGSLDSNGILTWGGRERSWSKTSSGSESSGWKRDTATDVLSQESSKARVMFNKRRTSRVNDEIKKSALNESTIWDINRIADVTDPTTTVPFEAADRVNTRAFETTKTVTNYVQPTQLERKTETVYKTVGGARGDNSIKKNVHSQVLKTLEALMMEMKLRDGYDNNRRRPGSIVYKISGQTMGSTGNRLVRKQTLGPVYNIRENNEVIKRKGHVPYIVDTAQGIRDLRNPFSGVVKREVVDGQVNRSRLGDSSSQNTQRVVQTNLLSDDRQGLFSQLSNSFAEVTASNYSGVATEPTFPNLSKVYALDIVDRTVVQGQQLTPTGQSIVDTGSLDVTNPFQNENTRTQLLQSKQTIIKADGNLIQNPFDGIRERFGTRNTQRFRNFTKLSEVIVPVGIVRIPTNRGLRVRQNSLLDNLTPQTLSSSSTRVDTSLGSTADNKLLSIEGKYFVGQMRRNEFGQFEPVPIAADYLLHRASVSESNRDLTTQRPTAATGVLEFSSKTVQNSGFREVQPSILERIERTGTTSDQQATVLEAIRATAGPARRGVAGGTETVTAPTHTNVKAISQQQTVDTLKPIVANVHSQSSERAATNKFDVIRQENPRTFLANQHQIFNSASNTRHDMEEQLNAAAEGLIKSQLKGTQPQSWDVNTQVTSMNTKGFIGQEELLRTIRQQFGINIEATRTADAEPPIIRTGRTRIIYGKGGISGGLVDMNCKDGTVLVCKAVGNNQHIPGMVWWCYSHCKNGICPEEKCSCTCETLQPEFLEGYQDNTASTKLRIASTDEAVSNGKKKVQKYIKLTLNGSEVSTDPATYVATVPVWDSRSGKEKITTIRTLQTSGTPTQLPVTVSLRRQEIVKADVSNTSINVNSNMAATSSKTSLTADLNTRANDVAFDDRKRQDSNDTAGLISRSNEGSLIITETIGQIRRTKSSVDDENSRDRMNLTQATVSETKGKVTDIDRNINEGVNTKAGSVLLEGSLSQVTHTRADFDANSRKNNQDSANAKLEETSVIAKDTNRNITTRSNLSQSPIIISGLYTKTIEMGSGNTENTNPVDTLRQDTSNQNVGQNQTSVISFQTNTFQKNVNTEPIVKQQPVVTDVSGTSSDTIINVSSNTHFQQDSHMTIVSKTTDTKVATGATSEDIQESTLTLGSDATGGAGQVVQTESTVNANGVKTETGLAYIIGTDRKPNTASNASSGIVHDTLLSRAVLTNTSIQTEKETNNETFANDQKISNTLLNTGNTISENNANTEALATNQISENKAKNDTFPTGSQISVSTVYTDMRATSQISESTGNNGAFETNNQISDSAVSNNTFTTISQTSDFTINTNTSATNNRVSESTVNNNQFATNNQMSDSTVNRNVFVTGSQLSDHNTNNTNSFASKSEMSDSTVNIKSAATSSQISDTAVQSDTLATSRVSGSTVNTDAFATNSQISEATVNTSATSADSQGRAPGPMTYEIKITRTVTGDGASLDTPTVNVTCVGINAFASTEGIDEWCTRLCSMDMCPIDICSCEKL